MGNVQVGKKAFVVNNGKGYSTYQGWQKKYNHTGKIFLYDDLIPEGVIVDVEVIARHESSQGGIVCGVVFKDRFYMIGIDGLIPAGNIRQAPVLDALAAYRDGSDVLMRVEGELRNFKGTPSVDELLDGEFYVINSEEAAE